MIVSPDQLPGQVAKLRELLVVLTDLVENLWMEETGGYLPISVEQRLNCFEATVVARLEEIEVMRLRVEDDRLGRLTAMLKPMSLGDAESFFYALNNNSFIPLIMERLYGDAYNINLAGFTLHLLRTMSQRLVAYQKWFDLTIEKDDLITSKIFVLRKALQVEISDAGGSPPQLLVELLAKTETYKSAALNLWVRQVDMGDMQEIIDFSNIPQSERIGDMFDELLPELVEIIYGSDPTRFLHTLNFISILKWDMHKGTGLDKMWDLVGGTGELGVVLALKIKEAMDQLDPSSELAKQRFEDLKAKLPKLHRDLQWHDTCRIKLKDPLVPNQFQPMFADYTKAIEDGYTERAIYAWIPGDSRADGRFRFTHKLDPATNAVTYNIEGVPDSSIPNPGDERYLDLYRHAKDGTSSKTVSLRCAKSEFNWIIEPAGDDTVRFKHAVENGYLMASTSIDADTRQVVIWTHTVIAPTDHVWTLECYS